jgi:hypothetical protein
MGSFASRDDVADAVQANVPPACRNTVRFLLAGEISNIYKRHGAVRKVHNIIFAPSLDAVERIQQSLEKIGNIRSDGRPILGLDSRDLLEIVPGDRPGLSPDPGAHLDTVVFDARLQVRLRFGWRSASAISRRTSLRWKLGFPPTRR